MGTCKYLLPDRNGHPILESILKSASQFAFSTVAIVTSFENADAVGEICRQFKQLNVVVVCNPKQELGRFYSVQLGLRSVSEADYCFIHNADNPSLQTATLKLMYANRSNASVIIPVYGNKGGHPVLVNANVMVSLCSADSDSVLNVELKKADNLRVETKDSGILIDLDTSDAYREYITGEFSLI